MSGGTQQYDHDRRKIPVQESSDKCYSPSRHRVRTGVRVWQGRRACAAVLSPPVRRVPSSSLSGGASERLSGGAAETIKARCYCHLQGYLSLLLSIRVSHCNLALPLYKGGQDLLCEGRPIPRSSRERQQRERHHLPPLAKSSNTTIVTVSNPTIIPRQTSRSRGFTSSRGP